MSTYDQAIILDELNVKSLEFRDDVSEFAGISIKPDFAAIGRNFPKEQKGAVIGAIRKLDPAEAERELRTKDTVTLVIDGAETEVSKDNLLIETQKKEGFEAMTSGNLTVVLDKHLTPELIEEGFVRELISKIQTMRKEAGFEVMDRIRVSAAGNEKLQKVMERNRGQICRDVLADGIGFGEPEGYVKDWTINGEPVTLGVVKQ